MTTSQHFRLMNPDFTDGIDAAWEGDVITLDLPSGQAKVDANHLRHCLRLPYHIEEPETGWRKDFSDDEKRKLRPIAETLAMLDGNAFFGQDVRGREWYEGYLAEAAELYSRNGGDSGWAGEASFVKSTVRAEALEQAAKVADAAAEDSFNHDDAGDETTALNIARAIRSLLAPPLKDTQ